MQGKPRSLHIYYSQALTSLSMAKGLELIGERYSLIVLIFFIPYVLFQPPATVALRKVGPRRFLPAITILWGACMIVRSLSSLTRALTNM